MPKPIERRERNRESDARRGSARKRGYTTAWDKAAKAYKNENPLCCMCQKLGFIRATFAVDHIEPASIAPDRFWDKTNWQPLCEEHHNSDKQREDKGGRARVKISASGWPEA